MLAVEEERLLQQQLLRRPLEVPRASRWGGSRDTNRERERERERERKRERERERERGAEAEAEAVEEDT